MVEHWGIGMAEGFLHEFQGWMMFMVSAALMLGEIAVLNRIGHESGHLAAAVRRRVPGADAEGRRVASAWLAPAFVAAGAILVGFVVLALVMPRAGGGHSCPRELRRVPDAVGPAGRDIRRASRECTSTS